MFSPSLKSASDAKSFLWTFPECPVRIHVNFEFINRLQKEVLDSAPADREVGGLLIADSFSPNGDIEISDYIALPPGSEATKNFIICSGSLAKTIQSSSALHRRVVGFYRTHLEGRIDLRAPDLECIRSKFNDPANVFLLIRPHDGRNSAGFFFWNEGAVVGGLTFPFSRDALNSPEWSTLMGGSPQESRSPSLLLGAREKALRATTGLKIGAVVLVLILIALAGAMRFYRSTPSPPPTLGLRVERALLGVVVAWNPTAPEIASAKDGDLVIWDGASPPAFLRLTPAQLLAGRTFFTSVSDRVEVRLDVIGASGVARTESIVSTSHAPDFGAPVNSSPPPTPDITANNSAKPAGQIPPANAPVGSPPQPAANASSIFTELSKPASPPAGHVEEPLIPPVLHSLDTRPEPPPPDVPDRPEPPRPREVQQTVAEAQPRPIVPEQQQKAPVPETQQRPIVPEPQQKPAAPEIQQRPAPENQQRPTAPPVREQPAAPPPGSIQVAVPIRELQPAIPNQVKLMIHSDNLVEVRVRINASGEVTEAQVGTVRGPVAGLLTRPALSAARGWRFRPATENGKPVTSEKILEFLFRPSSH